jgi:sulfate adenylyltransferase subunit 2
MKDYNQSHLKQLESEAIHIIREAVAEAENPVMLYSIGKDSSVMVRLAQKAFYPAKVPFPLLHIDSKWKFKEMIQFRDKFCRENNLDLKVHYNKKAFEDGVGPFTHGSRKHTDIMKTQALLQALDEGKYDIAFGGARRDEEKSRAKERIYSFRDQFHQWDPKNQRPELWSLYNSKINPGESIRVFPISNWTEMDVWYYIQQENIPIVPLYFAEKRKVIEKDGVMIMVDDERIPTEGYEIKEEMIRFRTLGCYPLTGAIHSTATTMKEIIDEMTLSDVSERNTRVIDFDGDSSMEQKKREGYF